MGSNAVFAKGIRRGADASYWKALAQRKSHIPWADLLKC